MPNVPATTSTLIRPAKPTDIARIASFNIAMAWETEKVRLNAYTVEHGVQAAVEDPAKGRYFIAEIDGNMVGCLMVTHEWSDWRNGDIWWVQSVYVDPNHRRKGVFSALYKHVEAEAIHSSVVAIRLYVEHDNQAGKTTYGKLGLALTHYDVMERDLRNL